MAVTRAEPLTTLQSTPLWMSLTGMALLVLGAKLVLIAAFAGPTPFWDQWDAEAAALYKPYLDGSLDLDALISPHNEHRILWTRLISLGLLELGGRWHPEMQMIVNAALHVAALVLLVCWLSQGLTSSQRWLLALATALFFALPFGWENTLAAFQLQFSVLLIFSIASLYYGFDADGLSSRWWISLALAVAAYFAMASGALTLFALLSLRVGQILLGRRSGWREYSAVVISLVVAALMLRGVPTIPFHAPLKAQSALHFVYAFAQAASWPFSPFEMRIPGPAFLRLIATLLSALIVNAPLIAVFLLAVRGGNGDDRVLAGYIVIGIWVLLQSASLAHGRAAGVLASRYLDLIVVGVVANVACLLYLVSRVLDVRMRKVAIAWVIAVIGVTVLLAFATLPQNVNERALHGRKQTANLSAFLATGDVAHLKDKPYLEIPYPTAERLATLASDPTIRSILPAKIMPPEEVRATKPKLLSGGYLASTFRTMEAVAGYLGLLFFLMGLAIFVRHALPYRYSR